MSVTRGRMIGHVEPGSPEWLTRMSASKIAAVVGLSPYQSRFSLWHEMAGILEREQTEVMSRGHFLEDGIADWFTHQHPEWGVNRTGTWVHHEHDWMAASPDRYVVKHAAACDGSDFEDALLEIKTAADSDEWGEPGTDQIPVGYRCQVQWQMHVTGVRTCYVAVLLPFLNFAEYRVDYNEADALYLEAEARAFMDTLPGGPNEERPNLDGHTATYAAVKELNPDVGSGDVEIPPSLASDYRQACADEKAAKQAKNYTSAEITLLLGDGKRAVVGTEVIAYKKAGRNGAPAYLQSSPPKKSQEKAA